MVLHVFRMSLNHIPNANIILGTLVLLYVGRTLLLYSQNLLISPLSLLLSQKFVHGYCVIRSKLWIFLLLVSFTFNWNSFLSWDWLIQWFYRLYSFNSKFNVFKSFYIKYLFEFSIIHLTNRLTVHFYRFYSCYWESFISILSVWFECGKFRTKKSFYSTFLESIFSFPQLLFE